jgi:hypothetical protein
MSSQPSHAGCACATRVATWTKARAISAWCQDKRESWRSTQRHKRAAQNGARTGACRTAARRRDSRAAALPAPATLPRASPRARARPRRRRRRAPPSPYKHCPVLRNSGTSSVRGAAVCHQSLSTSTPTPTEAAAFALRALGRDQSMASSAWLTLASVSRCVMAG